MQKSSPLLCAPEPVQEGPGAAQTAAVAPQRHDVQAVQVGAWKTTINRYETWVDA